MERSWEWGELKLSGKFDEIVAFSEVEKFLDTPVKRYSSGMYVRLAFAVAAHLEPEILIVDEVLAVGDAAFQKKCLGKMGEVAKGGRTVLFVSHNMAAVQSLCNTGVYLQSGTVRAVGDVASLLQRYYADTAEPNSMRSDQLGEDITVLRLETAPRVVETGAPAVLKLCIRADKDVTIRELAILFHSANGVRVGIIDLRSHGFPLSLDAGAEWEATVDVAAIPFVDGEYSLGLFCSTANFQKNSPAIRSLTVTARAGGNTPYPAEYRGLVELQVEVSTSHTGRTVAAAV